MPEKKQEEEVFTGLGVSPGIGIGIVHLREAGAVVVPEYRIAASAVARERKRLKAAARQARQRIGRLRAKAQTVPGAAGEELEILLEAYAQMLKDSRLVRGARQRIIDQRMNAEAAVQAEVAEITQTFAEMDDPYLSARIADIRDVGARLIRTLTRTHDRPLSLMPKGSVIVAEDLTPAETAQLDPKRVFAVTSALGGAESHTAIMARALGLPAVLGITGLAAAARNGDTILVDGDSGRAILNPSARTLAAYTRRQKEQEVETRLLGRLRRKPAITKDGTEVRLMANVELPLELAHVEKSGAQGIGLLRTEFMYMNRREVPSEEEQYENLREIIEAMQGRPVTVRTLDVGGEKSSAALMGEYAESASSALGLRGIRLTLARVDLLETQLRAILRASVHGDLRILLPMVTSVAEVRRAREALERARRRLRSRRVALPDTLPPVGVMIEVPGAALAADALAGVADFFAIGSNDLTMYTLAIDRGDEQVADLYNPLHPAVLRLIQFSAAAAFRARIPCSICGEIAGDPRFTPLLLGLGIRDLSMTASNIPRVKQRVLTLELASAIKRADLIMSQVDAGRIATLLGDFNGLT